MPRHNLDLTISIEEPKGFCPMPSLEQTTRDLHAAVMICQQGGKDIADIAGQMERHEEAGVILSDYLAEAQRRLRALGAMVENAEQRLLFALAD